MLEYRPSVLTGRFIVLPDVQHERESGIVTGPTDGNLPDVDASRTTSRSSSWMALVTMYVLFACCVFLLLTGLPALLGVVLPGSIVLLCLAVLHSRRPAFSSLGMVLAGFVAGLCVFCLLWRGGFVAWPMAGTGDLRTYLFLLVSHVVLVLLLLAGILWGTWGCQIPHLVRWGDSKKRFWVLAVPAVALWIWTSYFVFLNPLGSAIPTFLFLIVALAKACLTGFGEEAFYRGLVLPATSERYGPAAALVFQALLYTSFHFPLSQTFSSKPVFLLVVFGMGLAFGAMTQWTKGIGWAAVYHTALDVVVEWGNIL